MPSAAPSELKLWESGRLLSAYRFFGAQSTQGGTSSGVQGTPAGTKPGAQSTPAGTKTGAQSAPVGIKPGTQSTPAGTWFRVWAPRADAVFVIGDFNDWDGGADKMEAVGTDMARFWELFVPSAGPGNRYKFRIQRGGLFFDKSDPFGFEMEPPVPGGSTIAGLASVVADLSFDWSDDDWVDERRGPSGLSDAVSIYEIHPGSWRRHADGGFYSYRELAEPLAEYVLKHGFTHVELMPIMEHPFYGSWGYQVVGYFAPTCRYGTPADFKYFVNYLHNRGIGVILDWVPAHFATDPQGLCFFDGGPLYEYEDPDMRHHPDWGTYVFDYARPQVANFLVSNALFWLEEYHIDGLRIDAVASMLYLDYSRTKWTPNRLGGRENLEAEALLKRINEVVYSRFPEALMIAEESTAWPGVTRPTAHRGLGFLYKWNMGWMHDTLQFFREDPVHRVYHFGSFTFPLMYAWSEQYISALSHDEVVHGKGSMWGKMPGDSWQKAANLRLLYGHQFGHPGKKLTFMGGEFAQRAEWDHDAELEWGVVGGVGTGAAALTGGSATSEATASRATPDAATSRAATSTTTGTSAPDSSTAASSHSALDPANLHEGIRRWFTFLNELYARSPALRNDLPDGFRWIDHSDSENSTASYLRMGQDETLMFVFNFTPVPRPAYPIGSPDVSGWTVIANSDERVYGGSGNQAASPWPGTPVLLAAGKGFHGHPSSIRLDLPPLGVLILRADPT